MTPKVRTILDIGGQDYKVIQCDEGGRPLQFAMNDKCAAGTGRAMEIIADLLEIPISQVGQLSLSVQSEPQPISSTCVVFAKSEVIGLLGKTKSIPLVLAAYLFGMAVRLSVMAQRVGLRKECTISGGMAKNIGLVKRLERELGIEFVPLSPDPMIAGALGAAVMARDALDRAKKA